jgi:hypothetical protein
MLDRRIVRLMVGSVMRRFWPPVKTRKSYRHEDAGQASQRWPVNLLSPQKSVQTKALHSRTKH